MIMFGVVSRPLRLSVGRKWITKIGASRRYSTRSESDFPFEKLKVKKRPFINWKTAGAFFLIGSFLTYKEVYLKVYENYTAIDDSKEDLSSTRLEYELTQVPIYQELSHPKNSEKWIRMRSWENLDHNIFHKVNNKRQIKTEESCEKHDLMSNVLSKPGGFSVPPVIFFNKETNESVTIAHVGYRLTGYPFIIHGGVTATLLNEGYKMHASLSSDTSSNLKGDFKVESLKINYRFPILANQFIIMRTKPEKRIDKKNIELSNTILSEGGRLCVKSKALLCNTGKENNSLKIWQL